jgi:NADH-quinone oxidoreductase subunit I
VFGEGIIQGLAETARNFFGSYFFKDRLTTIQYPEQRAAAIESSRVFPMLVYDGADALAGLRCTSCQICEKECPPKCIFIEKSKDRKPDFVGRQQFYPARFEIDISVCMSCQICVEVCPFDSIKMDTRFDYPTTDRFGGLLIPRGQLAKSNEYYNHIHPAEAGAIDVHRAEEVAKAEARAQAATAKVAQPTTPQAAGA